MRMQIVTVRGRGSFLCLFGQMERRRWRNGDEDDDGEVEVKIEEEETREEEEKEGEGEGMGKWKNGRWEWGMHNGESEKVEMCIAMYDVEDVISDKLCLDFRVCMYYHIYYIILCILYIISMI